MNYMQNPAIFHNTTIRKGGTAQVPSPQGETSHIQSQHSLDCTDVPLLNSWHKDLLSVAKAATSFVAECLLPPQYTLTVAECHTACSLWGAHASQGGCHSTWGHAGQVRAAQGLLSWGRVAGDAGHTWWWSTPSSAAEGRKKLQLLGALPIWKPDGEGPLTALKEVQPLTALP